MGSIIGGGSAKKAAQKQADALDRQTLANTKNANYQVEAMADMMAQAQAAKVAAAYAERLLSKPIDSVNVTLGTSDLDVQTDNLLGRRRTTRQSYQAPVTPTAQSRITRQPLSIL